MIHSLRKPVWALLFIVSTITFAFDIESSPCGGPNALLSLVNRPTLADSSCVVPFKSVVVESGYTNLSLIDNGNQEIFPQSVFRLGLPSSSEFFVLLPNFIDQSVPPYSGLSATTMGMKRVVVANPKWVATVESVFTIPSGSVAYGSRGLGEAFNGIVNYQITSSISVNAILGISSQTQSILQGGKRFLTINPDLVLSWSKDKLLLYGEVYAQSKTAPDQGSGVMSDAGVLYLLKNNIAVDFEVGQRISGSIGGFNHYFGTGISFQIE